MADPHLFAPSDQPRLFGLPPGADFPKYLVAGLRDRLRDAPPEAMARVTLIVNSRRMARRIRTLFDQGPPGFLPKIMLVTDLGDQVALGDIPAPVSPLRRRLALAQLVSALIEAEPDLAPRSALYDLSDSLAKLFDEMRGEGVEFSAIRDLDVSSHSAHWARALKFLTIVGQLDDADGPDPETQMRIVAEHLAQRWRDTPPRDPVIIAGSTGSRGATHVLMEAVAKLPQGAVVVPGFDFDMPEQAWSHISDAIMGEDHPQFRFGKLARSLGIGIGAVERWTETRQNDARNRLVSLALRPAPVTDQWLTEGPGLTGLEMAFDGVTLVEAPSAREEAMTIALRLRKAAQDGKRAALITPDVTLMRQVSAALDRWKIEPDMSAGEVLSLAPQGRFLRHISALFHQKISADLLLVLLKHPICHSGAERGQHLLMTRELELALRRHGPPYPDAQTIRTFAATQNHEIAAKWAEWLCDVLDRIAVTGPIDLVTLVAHHRDLAERLAQGCLQGGLDGLWGNAAGRVAQKMITDLAEAADAGGAMSGLDYANMVAAIMRGHEVRDPDSPHPDILIWGALEARVQGADLVILGGLNEGSWPEAPNPDPWLNRDMRARAGMLLPERNIGLAAHDFQQAIAAPEVWLTRSLRSADAETVTSRWLNRITNLLNGLPQPAPMILDQARDRGRTWIAMAAKLEDVTPVPPARRPAPCPPVHARPRRMSVTDIKKLIRDPYAIYAKGVLRLTPLNPVMKAPDALLRGIVAHEVLENFVRETRGDPALLTPEYLLDLTRRTLGQEVPWAETRILWQAAMQRAADGFVADEKKRQQAAGPAAFEVDGKAEIAELGFTLTAQADRIDIDGNGRAHIFDYKTGTVSGEKQQKSFDLQLLLEAAMVERGAFRDLAPMPVERAAFVGVGSKQGEVPAPLDDLPPDKLWARFSSLIHQYFDETQPFTARRAMFKSEDHSDYDHLSRYGEWGIADNPNKERLE
jgi:double-strand break repair protein AddB